MSRSAWIRSGFIGTGILVAALGSVPAFAAEAVTKKPTLPTQTPQTSQAASTTPALSTLPAAQAEASDLLAPPTPADAEVPTHKRVRERRTQQDEDERWWHVGPHFGINIPHLINFGVQARFFRHFGAEINYGFIPEITVSDYFKTPSGSEVKAAFNQFDYLTARVFPFGGALFVGLGVSSLKIKASGTGSVLGQTYKAQAETNRTQLTPSVGWRWGGTKGLFFGLDLGVSIALGTPQLTFTDDTPAIVKATAQYQATQADIRKVYDDVKTIPLPSFTMFQIGYLF